jgi:hypothetical protein
MDNKLIGGTLLVEVAAAIVLCLIGGLTRGGWAAGSWAVLLALAIAPLATDRPFLGEQPQWRASDPDFKSAEQRIILCAVQLAVSAMALSARRLPAWPRAVLAAVAPAAILLWIVTAYPGPPLAGWPVRLGVPAAASLVLWCLIEPLAIRRPTSIAAPWVCGCLTAGVALLNLFSNVQGPGWVALAIGGVIGGTFLFALTGRGPSFAGGPVVVVVALLACLAAANRIGSGNVPASRWAILALAPALAWVVELRPMRNWRPWLREPLRMALVLIPVVIAVVPAYRDYAAQQAEEMGDMG